MCWLVGLYIIALIDRYRYDGTRRGFLDVEWMGLWACVPHDLLVTKRPAIDIAIWNSCWAEHSCLCVIYVYGDPKHPSRRIQCVAYIACNSYHANHVTDHSSLSRKIYNASASTRSLDRWRGWKLSTRFQDHFGALDSLVTKQGSDKQ